MSERFRAAAVQAAPVFLDLAGTVAKTVRLIGEAAAAGAKLVAFPECWCPGYPWWIWLGSPAWGMKFMVPYFRNALRRDSAEMARICAAAREHRIVVVLGYAEIEGGTLYMAQSIIDDEGRVLAHRRKLKPARVERSVFGQGDGSDLAVVDTALGRVGALCCGEHFQPLLKCAMFAQSEQIHVAAWPAFSLLRGKAYLNGPEAATVASQMYAIEGQCFVLAPDGAYNGTTFHRAVLRGLVQGGDPLSKDAAKKALYGTGGLGVLKSEANAEKHTRGAVSAVLQPGRPDSAGSQFFICVSDQPTLDGQYTVFGRVVEGLDVAQKISEAPTDAEGKLTDRITITSATIRDTPPPEAVPFETETPEQLARYRAVIETTAGAITLEFFPDKAPEHVRNFLRLAKTGVYDGTAFHRVVPGFVIQAGHMPSRREPPTEKQRTFIKTSMPPEFNDTPHVKGILSMARLDDPASASTSFFIVTGPASSLDKKYTVFGRVIDGMPVVDTIEQAPRQGEEPNPRIDVVRVRVEDKP